MPTVKLSPVTAWSFSRYRDYKKCPAYFKFRHVLRLPEPGNEAMARGTSIHKMAEEFVKGKAAKLPAELGAFKEEFKALKKEKIKTVEDSWTWTKDWQSETRATDWSNAWLRVKIDVTWTDPALNALHIVDHKTGKVSNYKTSEYVEQLELYGLAGLKKMPHIERVFPKLWYLDAGIIWAAPEGEEPMEFTRADEKPLEKKWALRIKPMFNDKTYRPTPSRVCEWCHFAKSKGGPCANG